MQTTFGNSLPALVEGQFAKERHSAEVASAVVDAASGIKPGRFVGQSGEENVRLPYSNTITLTFSADTVASNTINGSLVLNGATTAMAQVTYASSHANTMDLIVAALENIVGVASAVVGADGSGNANRRITITLDHEIDGYATGFIVAAGASQATITMANDTAEPLYGIVPLTLLEPDSSGNVQYANGAAAPVGRKAYIAVRSDDALVKGQSVYVRYYEESADDKKRGMVMASAGTSGGITRAKLFANAYVERGCAAGGLAVIGVNLPA